jgi:mevalonate kinase
LRESSHKKIDPVKFKGNILTMRFIFKNGKVAPFLTKDGRTSEYTTNIEHEVQELMHEIDMHHPNITVAPEEEVKLVMEPVEALKARHFEEFKKMMTATLVKTNDAGSSEQGQLKVANSTTISEGAAGSDSTGAGAGVSASAAPATLKISIGK